MLRAPMAADDLSQGASAQHRGGGVRARRHSARQQRVRPGHRADHRRRTSTARRTARSCGRCIELSERHEPVDLVTLADALRGAQRAAGRRRRRLPRRARRARPDRRQRRPLRPHREGQGDPARADPDRDRDRACAATRHRATSRPSSTRPSTRSSRSPSARRGRRSSACATSCIESMKAVEQLYERQELVTGVPTGFIDLDKKTAGLQPGDLIIVAGRPSMGKTALRAQHRAARRARGEAPAWRCSRSRCRRSSSSCACSAPRRASTSRRSAPATPRSAD